MIILNVLKGSGGFALTLHVLHPVLTRGAEALVLGGVITFSSILISISLVARRQGRWGCQHLKNYRPGEADGNSDRDPRSHERAAGIDWHTRIQLSNHL